VTRAFAYRGGRLFAEGVPLEEIAERVGTPCWVYSASAMRDRLRAFQSAFQGVPATVCYALKANANLAVIRTLVHQGAGADIVSAGELERALAVGVPPERIVFSGVGKSAAEMDDALDAGIGQFNVESVPELMALNDVAIQRRTTAPVALRINPDVAADTHDKISTGRRQDKFGIAYDRAEEAFALAAKQPGIEVLGLHLHIGSQILSLAPFEAAYTRGLELIARLRQAGIRICRLDLGGGFGVPYRGDARLDLAGYAAMVRRLTDGQGLELVFEPGRYLVAEAGVLLARVLYLKEGASRPCVVLDAGMNNLIRPALYDSWHEILPLREADGRDLQVVDVVGPICETGDLFARERPLPPLAAGDLVAFAEAGAYGAVMASDYNSRPWAAEVMVNGGRWVLVKPRIEPAARFADEMLPDWLQPSLLEGVAD
jgi:diaminopimelate decarboxylase